MGKCCCIQGAVMVEILNRWTKEPIFRVEAADIGAAVREAVASRVDLSEGVLPNADLKRAFLTNAVLKWADLTGANLMDADLSRGVLRRANLTGAVLTGANLTNANLTGAVLTGAVLRNAILKRANLTDADLTDAVFTNADLRYADLTDADLTRVVLTNSNCGTALGDFLRVTGTRDQIIAVDEENISIGCRRNNLAWWREHYAAAGRVEQYSAAQIEEYRLHIEYVAAWLAARHTVNVKEVKK